MPTCGRNSCFNNATQGNICDTCFDEWVISPGLYIQDYKAFLFTKPGSVKTVSGPVNRLIFHLATGGRITCESVNLRFGSGFYSWSDRENYGDDAVRIDGLVTRYGENVTTNEFKWYPSYGVTMIKRAVFELAVKEYVKRMQEIKLIVIKHSIAV